MSRVQGHCRVPKRFWNHRCKSHCHLEQESSMELRGLSDLLGNQQIFFLPWTFSQLAYKTAIRYWDQNALEIKTSWFCDIGRRGGLNFLIFFFRGEKVRQRNIKFPSNNSKKNSFHFKGWPDLLDSHFASNNHIFYVSLHILIILAHTRMFHECLSMLDHIIIWA